MTYIQKAVYWINRIENGVLVWTILGLAAFGFIQVITRYVLNISFAWFEELGRYLGVLITFLGASIGVKTSTHFAMDSIVRKLPYPWIQIVYCFTAALSGSFCLLVVFISLKIVSRQYGYETTSPAMEIPMYWAYLPIPIFSFVMAIRFYMKGIQFLFELFAKKKEQGGR